MVEPAKLKMALPDDLLAHAEVVSQIFMQAMFKAIGERMIEELSLSDLTYAQMQALRYLHTHRRVTVGDLADGLGISYPSATNMVHRLEKKDFIKRIANPRDRRQVGIRLTEEGLSLINRIDQERKQRFAMILSQMDANERHAFIKGLQAFIRTGIENRILPADEICLHCGSQKDPLCPILETQSVEFCR